MKVGPIPKGPLEWLLLRLRVAPQPLIDTQLAYTLARVVMVGVRLGIFDALASGPATAAVVADRCGTHPVATGKLLFALAGSGYVQSDGTRYSLSALSRKWLLSDRKSSLVDKLLLQFLEWDWLERSEDYVRTGEPMELHEVLSPGGWDAYQRGMRALAVPFSAEATRRMPIPSGACDLLDIGGSHGHYSSALCRRHDGLRAVVLDLPEAVQQAAPLLAAEQMGDRVVHRAGNALTDDLGHQDWDFVLISQVVHHFSEQQNRDLTRRVACALRPGGVYAVMEAFRAPRPRDAGQLGALLDFNFALTSRSGTWTPAEIADWQREANLRPRRTIHLRSVPGTGIQAAVKPSNLD